MNTRTHRLLLLAVSLTFAALAALVVFSTTGSGDYQLHAPVAGDNAAPALGALAHGHLAAFLAHQPLMGLVSLALRGPVLVGASAAGAGSELSYELGALACLLPLAGLGGALVTIPGLRGPDRVPAIAGVVLALAGPATVAAVTIGHPEEVLAITLATGAVVTALADRPLLTAILLGLAVGTKPWALLAAAPVAAALPASRLRVLGFAGLVALPCVALLPLGDPSAFARAGTAVGHMHQTDPLSLWWPVSGPLHGVGSHRLPLGLDRSVASGLALTVALLATAWCARRSIRRGRQLDPLALLALLGLIRCAVDPVPLEYNLVAVLIPLAAWEALELGRLPLLAALATLAGVLLYGGRVDASPTLTNALVVAGVLALGVCLARDAFHRRIRSLRTAAHDHTRPMPSLASGVTA